MSVELWRDKSFVGWDPSLGAQDDGKENDPLTKVDLVLRMFINRAPDGRQFLLRVGGAIAYGEVHLHSR